MMRFHDYYNDEGPPVVLDWLIDEATQDDENPEKWYVDVARWTIDGQDDGPDEDEYLIAKDMLGGEYASPESVTLYVPEHYPDYDQNDGEDGWGSDDPDDPWDCLEINRYYVFSKKKPTRAWEIEVDEWGNCSEYLLYSNL